MTTTEKTCNCCDKTMSVSEFYRHPTSSDGFHPKCKSCCKAYTTKRRRETGYASQRKYEKSEKGIAARFAHDKPRMTLNYALRTGRINKLPCFICGCEKTEAHHPDYSSPLDVVWLCPAHHKQTHAMAKRIERKIA